jgi:hypothetical protein
MNTPSPLRMTALGFVTALGFAFSSAALAQSPPPAPPGPPIDRPPSVPAVPPAPPQLPVLTQSSRVRAFYPGPGGEVRNLYLQNGSVVDLTPTLGGQLGPAVRKGEKITVTGTKSEINGRSLRIHPRPSLAHLLKARFRRSQAHLHPRHDARSNRLHLRPARCQRTHLHRRPISVAPLLRHQMEWLRHHLLKIKEHWSCEQH